ncbi:MAG: hypothetical protein CMH53_04430 [Myxococcales bacterium]|nr:hypothetical protein [Myxococcales bacterium]
MKNLSRGELKGRLWFETSGSGRDVPYFCRTRFEDVVVDIPKELEPKPREDQMSILTEFGETFEP